MHSPYIEKYGHYHSDKLADILSGLYNAGFSLGVIIGPFLASYITLWLDSYRMQSDFFAFFGISFGVMHILIVSLFKRRKETPVKTQT